VLQRKLLPWNLGVITLITTSTAVSVAKKTAPVEFKL